MPIGPLPINKIPKKNVTDQTNVTKCPTFEKVSWHRTIPDTKLLWHTTLFADEDNNNTLKGSSWQVAILERDFK